MTKILFSDHDQDKDDIYLETVAALGLLPDDVKDAVDELGALGVVPLGPVVAGAALPEHEVVRSEDGAVGSGPEERGRSVWKITMTR